MGRCLMSPEHVIEFDDNYNNKLNNPLFTSIRKYSEEKRKYYRRCAGSTFKIILKGKHVGNAILIGTIFIGSLSKISQTELMLDTGLLGYGQNMTLFKKFGIEKDDDVIHLLFQNYEVI